MTSVTTIEREILRPCAACAADGATVACDLCVRDRIAWWHNLHFKTVARRADAGGYIPRCSARQYSAELERLAHVVAQAREGRC